MIWKEWMVAVGGGAHGGFPVCLWSNVGWKNKKEQVQIDKAGTWVAVSVNYVNNDNRTLLYYLVVRAVVGQRQRRCMMALAGGDGGGAPALPLMCGTGDDNRWHSCCGGVDVVRMVGVLRQSIWRCNMVISWPARASTWWVMCVYTHVTDLYRKVGKVKYR
jgi:hypothetical protein